MSRRLIILIALAVVAGAGLWVFGWAAYLGVFDPTYRVRGTVSSVRVIPNDDGFVSACLTGTADAGTEGATVDWDDPVCEEFPKADAPKVGACIAIESGPHRMATFRPDRGCVPRR